MVSSGTRSAKHTPDSVKHREPILRPKLNWTISNRDLGPLPARRSSRFNSRMYKTSSETIGALPYDLADLAQEPLHGRNVNIYNRSVSRRCMIIFPAGWDNFAVTWLSNNGAAYPRYRFVTSGVSRHWR